MNIIKETRLMKGMSAKKAADCCHVSVSTYNRWEKDMSKLTVKKLLEISLQLGFVIH